MGYFQDDDLSSLRYGDKPKTEDAELVVKDNNGDSLPSYALTDNDAMISKNKSALHDYKSLPGQEILKSRSAAYNLKSLLTPSSSDKEEKSKFASTYQQTLPSKTSIALKQTKLTFLKSLLDPPETEKDDELNTVTIEKPDIEQEISKSRSTEDLQQETVTLEVKQHQTSTSNSTNDTSLTNSIISSIESSHIEDIIISDNSIPSRTPISKKRVSRVTFDNRNLTKRTINTNKKQTVDSTNITTVTVDYKIKPNFMLGYDEMYYDDMTDESCIITPADRLDEGMILNKAIF